MKPHKLLFRQGQITTHNGVEVFMRYISKLHVLKFVFESIVQQLKKYNKKRRLQNDLNHIDYAKGQLISEGKSPKKWTKFMKEFCPNL